MTHLLEYGHAKNFNSHAHVERDAYITKSGMTKEISTHTLTWSVTRKGFYKSHVQWDFNSHAHVERDAVTAELN